MAVSVTDPSNLPNCGFISSKKGHSLEDILECIVLKYRKYLAY